jgi:Flp pilus assembly protein protease CpaA
MRTMTPLAHALDVLLYEPFWFYTAMTACALAVIILLGYAVWLTREHRRLTREIAEHDKKFTRKQ